MFFLIVLVATIQEGFPQQKKKKKPKGKHTLNTNNYATVNAHKNKGPYKKSTLELAGDKFFEAFEYVKAAEEYKKAYEHDTTHKYALFQLAESYRLYFDYLNAQRYYKEAVKTALHEYPLARYWYGIMLKDNKQYMEAQNTMEQFRKEYKAHDLAAELYKEKAYNEIKGCIKAMEELKKPQRNFEFKSLPIPGNSVQSDFSPVIIDNDSTIALTSTREESTGKHEGNLGGNLSDVYRFKKESGDTWTAIAHQHDGFDVMNTAFNESAGSFTEDRTKFYFTRCDDKVRVGNYLEYNCAIYVSYFKDGKWGKPIKLNENVNSPGHWNAQPSVSPDGTVLFFVSRRPGGLGMHDIWYSTCPGNDKWGKAINMGEHVNTLFSDISPRYYAKEKLLFFSSNGHENFGGFDVFFVNEDTLQSVIHNPNILPEDVDIVKNIGMPFNSERDDQYFVLGEKRGYIASNREGGIGNYDIYTFKLESKEGPLLAYIKHDTTQLAKSIDIDVKLVHADTKEPAKDVQISLRDTSQVLLRTKTDTAGKATFTNVPNDKDLTVHVDEKGTNILKEVKITSDVEIRGSDKVATRTLFENIYFDFNKADIKPEAKKVLDRLIAFYKEHSEIQIELSANTDSYGSDDYNRKLSTNRGNAAEQYLLAHGVKRTAIVINAEGEGKPISTNESEIGRQLNRRVEFYIRCGVGYKADLTVEQMDPQKRALYYLSKQYNMSVEDMQRYIEHEKDNVTITTKKDPTTASTEGIEYYIAQPKNTLYTIARLYGMSLAELRELNGINDTYQGVVVGQRVKVKPKPAPSSEFYVVKEGETLYSIAKKFEMSVDDLVKLNSIEGYILKRNMLIKVKQ
ncbi:MAG: LysM peptidoglycan-binding domain-containing protein [Cytophagaceae bacterium]|nr:LysM peptidoglycan-binding domain-containing protein [Cytophagaceae bacterium]